MISREEAQARVARGAAHLDQVRPGWFTQIDTGTLTLHDPCGCIVGQLCYPLTFMAGVEVLFGAYGYHPVSGLRTASHHGVDLPHTQATLQDFAILQDAWIDAIAARRHPVQESQEPPVPHVALGCAAPEIR